MYALFIKMYSFLSKHIHIYVYAQTSIDVHCDIYYKPTSLISPPLFVPAQPASPL